MLLTYLVYSALLTASLFLPAGFSRAFAGETFWKGLWWEWGNRGTPGPTSPFSGRAARVFNNSIESFGTFAVVAIVAQLTARNPHLSGLIAQGYFFARVIYCVLYWLGIPVLRTLAYQASFAATVALGLLDLGLIG